MTAQEQKASEAVNDYLRKYPIVANPQQLVDFKAMIDEVVKQAQESERAKWEREKQRIEITAQKVIGYSQHDGTCSIGPGLYDEWVECDCGFKDALDELRAALAQFDMEKADV